MDNLTLILFVLSIILPLPYTDEQEGVSYPWSDQGHTYW